MKRKIYILFLSLICVAITLFASGCSVKGKSYVYSEVKIVSKGDLSGEAAQAIKEEVEKDFDGAVFTFSKNGSSDLNNEQLKWKQEGSKIYLSGAQGFNISGKVSFGKLVYEYERSGVKFEIVFKSI